MRKKAERRWTLMVVPHGSGSSRAVEVSQTFVKALVGIGSVVALTFLVLGVAAISRGVNITHSRALENENRLLADEIQRMRERMTGLRDTLQRFGQRRSEEHTSELQSLTNLVCRLLAPTEIYTLSLHDALPISLVGIGSVVALTFLVLGVAAISRGVNITHSRALENENRLLADEIQRMRERMTGLRDTLQRFGQREQELRLLAGLTPTDTTVQQAGIGGPAGAWSERDSLKALGPQGQQALAARLDVDALARRANVLVRSLNQAYDSLSHQRERLAARPQIMPTKGWLTSAFARERIHPILHLARPHEGIDVTAPMGAEIEAPAAGIVTEVRWEEGYGNMITMDHGYGLVTRFAHCSKILVVRGQRVKRGQKIALVGSTGLSTGPHLHYEVWVNRKPVDPIKYVMPDAIVD